MRLGPEWELFDQEVNDHFRNRRENLVIMPVLCVQRGYVAPVTYFGLVITDKDREEMFGEGR